MAAPVKNSVNGPQTIDGVKVKPLRFLADERGWLMEILRADEPDLFTKFGQVYVSATYPGVVKGWHYHRKQVDNFVCVAGMVKLVLIDTATGGQLAATAGDARAGPEPRVPRVEVHQHRTLSRRQRAQ